MPDLNLLRKSGLQKILLIVMLIALVIGVLAVRQKQNITTKADVVDFLEAESYVSSNGDISIGEDSNASGNGYIQLGQPATNSPTPKSPTISPTPTKKPTPSPTKAPTPTPQPSRDVSKLLGVAVSPSSLTNYSGHIKKYGHAWLAPANVMKMQTIGGCNGNYNYGQADQILNYANQNGMKLHGHTLVWHNQTSSCAGSFTKAQLKTYITNVTKHYCGKTPTMDVVNEALSDGSGYRTDSVWYRLYGGPGYIEDSFRWAREACPSMKLYYNDYSIEYGAKAERMLSLVQSLHSKGLIDGVGFQAHWTRSFDATAWGKVMDRVTAMGLDFAISEMDVRFTKNYWDFTNADYTLQAQTYKNAAQLCKDKPRCDHFIVWGVHDGDSWVNNNPAFGNVEDAALLFDRQLRPKAAYCQGIRPVFGLPKGDCS